MFSIVSFLLAASLCLLSAVTCEPTPKAEECSEAEKLFSIADTNFDRQLTYDEFEEAFMSYDVDDDGYLRPEELLSLFVKEEVGQVRDALVLFYNLDVNADRTITPEPDLREAEKFFDTNEDQSISVLEFETQFAKLSDNYDDGLVTNSTLRIDSFE